MALAWVTGCAGSTDMVCKPDPITGSSSCMTSGNNVGSAAAVTGIAAGVYAVTGCTVNGCQLPDRCNPQSKRCEPITCRENMTCPAGYSCNMVTLTCR